MPIDDVHLKNSAMTCLLHLTGEQLSGEWFCEENKRRNKRLPSLALQLFAYINSSLIFFLYLVISCFLVVRDNHLKFHRKRENVTLTLSLLNLITLMCIDT